MSPDFPMACNYGSAQGGLLGSVCLPNRQIMGDRPDHTREQVKTFRASAQQLLDYHDATYERMKTYLKSLSADELARELDEPQYDPRPTVAVRMVSVLENAMTNEGRSVF